MCLILRTLDIERNFSIYLGICLPHFENLTFSSSLFLFRFSLTKISLKTAFLLSSHHNPDETRSELIKMFILSSESSSSYYLGLKPISLNSSSVVQWGVCRPFFAPGIASQVTYRVPYFIGEVCWGCMQPEGNTYRNY